MMRCMDRAFRRRGALSLGLVTALVAGCSGDKGGGGSGNDGNETSADASAGDADAGTADATGDGTGDGTADGGVLPGTCGTDSPGALLACVEGDRYQTDLEAIAKPRDPGSTHWQTVQDLCATRLESYGFTVTRENYATGVNVVGVKTGTESPSEQILLAAHYDHIPGCEGADDNASGVAGVLEAARVLSQRDYPRTLVVACWDEEELGLLGARAYADAAKAAGDDIVFNYNFEMIGFYSDTPNSQTIPTGLDVIFPTQAASLADEEYRGNFIALIVDEMGKSHMDAMAKYAELIDLRAIILDVPNDVKNSPLLSDLRRSDHAAFWQVDYPAAMITDTSEFRYPNYHCRNGLVDEVGNLDKSFSTKVVQASVAAAAESLGLAP